MSARVEQLIRIEDLDRVFSRPRALVYKHSARCWMCTNTLRDVRAFAGEHPDIDVFMVDVLGSREVSNEIAGRLDLKHESPQAILLEDGEAVWHANHMKITISSMNEAAAGS